MGSTTRQGRRARTASAGRRWAIPLALVLGGACALPCATDAQAAVGVPVDPAAAPAAGPTPFIVGSASGIAQGIRIVPAIGSYQAPVTVGTAIAGYNGTEGQASAQNLDLGAIGLDVTGPQCDGSAAPIKASSLPQPLIAESNGRDTASTQDLRGSSTVPPADAGVLSVAATTTPSATASTQGGVLSLPGLVAVSGAATSAAGGVVGAPGALARDVTAQASVASISLAGGLVSLGDVREVLHQRSGAGATASGGFTVGALTVAGAALPVTPGALAASLATANAALAATGIHLTLPVFTWQQDGTATVSPLEIGITNSELGHEAVAPALGSAEPIREALENELVSAKCQTSDGFSLGDLVLGTAAGSGSMNLELGGLSGTSEGTYYPSPFGFGGLGGAVEPLTGAGLSAGTAGTAGSAGTAGTAGTPRTTGGLTAAALPAAAAPAAAGVSTTSSPATLLGEVCSTTHAYAHTACDGNWAVPVGLGVLALAGALGAADALRGRGALTRRPALLGRGRRGLHKLTP